MIYFHFLLKFFIVMIKSCNQDERVLTFFSTALTLLSVQEVTNTSGEIVNKINKMIICIQHPKTVDCSLLLFKKGYTGDLCFRFNTHMTHIFLMKHSYSVS